MAVNIDATNLDSIKVCRCSCFRCCWKNGEIWQGNYK